MTFAAFQVSLPYRDGCDNHPLATDMPALFFPEPRVFDAWSLCVIPGWRGCILSNAGRFKIDACHMSIPVLKK
jgi:hypothetical protein